MSRAERMAVSLGRPSRRKKPPGIFPAAYIRSSTSTVSGKKSMPSRGALVTQVTRIWVSPRVTTQDPWACLASFPVSIETRAFPISRATMVAFMTTSLRSSGGEVVGGGPVLSGGPRGAL